MTAQTSGQAQGVDRTAAVPAGLGDVTRDVQESLLARGALSELQRLIKEMPDARERLAYVGTMTESAAHKVLNLVDDAQPRCRAQAREAQQFARVLQHSAADEALSLDHARRMLSQCADHASSTFAFAEQLGAALSDIMMAQDFQDLSGQVIKKVIDMIARTERQVAQFAEDTAGAPPMPAVVPSVTPTFAPQKACDLQGPQTPDNALAQEDVNDLLAELGF